MPGPGWPFGYSVAVRAENTLSLRCLGCDRDIHETEIIADDVAGAVEDLRLLAWAAYDDDAANRAAIEARRLDVVAESAPVYAGDAALDEDFTVSANAIPPGGQGGAAGNLDGGTPASQYGGITPIDGGGV